MAQFVWVKGQRWSSATSIGADHEASTLQIAGGGAEGNVWVGTEGGVKRVSVPVCKIVGGGTEDGVCGVVGARKGDSVRSDALWA